MVLQRRKRLIPQDVEDDNGDFNELVSPSCQRKRRALDSVNPGKSAGRPNPRSFSKKPALYSIVEESSHHEQAADSPEEEAVGYLKTVVGEDKHRIHIWLRAADFTIGRHRTANLVLPSATVSNIHAKVYACISDTSEKYAVYEDRSCNGSVWNGISFMQQSVILSDLDTITLGPYKLTYYHNAASAVLPADSKASAAAAPFVVDNYKVTARSLGSGTFSVVLLAIDQASGLQAACKVMKRSLIHKHGIREQIETEMQLMSQLSHPNIACFRHATLNKTHLYIFMNLLTAGDLHTYLSKRNKIECAEAKFLLYQIAKALQYLHDDLDIAHRDIKPENIVLRNHGPYPHILLSDFGAACKVNGELRTCITGTTSYWPPELFLSAHDGKAFDCWSLGVSLYLILYGQLPFTPDPQSNSNNQSVSSQIKRRALAAEPSSGDFRVAQSVREDVYKILDEEDLETAKNVLCANLLLKNKANGVFVDKHAKDLIRRLLTFEPKSRCKIREVLEHKWIDMNRNDLSTVYAKMVVASEPGPSRMPEML